MQRVSGINYEINKKNIVFVVFSFNLMCFYKNSVVGQRFVIDFVYPISSFDRLCL